MKRSLTSVISKIVLMCLFITSIGPVYSMQAAPAAPTPKINEGVVNGEFPLNLTQTGDIDWLHFKADNLNQLQRIQKGDPNSVTFSVYGDTATEGKLNRGTDADYMSYTWSNGMPGFEYGLNDTGTGLFYPKSSRDKGSYNNVGWDIEVAPQPQDSTLVFGLGLWQADIDLNIYTDDVLSVTRNVYGDSVSKNYKYQVNVPANVKLKIEGRLTKVVAKNGNMSFSGLALSSVALADKLPLQNEYNRVSNMTQGLYTNETWQVLVNTLAAAKLVLDRTEATQPEVDSAINALVAAQLGLVKRESNIVIDFTDKAFKEYTFGAKTDQQDRYQTFTVKEAVDMKYVQVNVKRYKEPVSDLIIKLHAVNSEGLPTGDPLVQTTVDKNRIVDGGLTTAELSYSLLQDTRYALVLTQQERGSGEYRWVIMSKNFESQQESFGKSTSGVFKSEASLGTGIMRIVKEGNVDRAPLQGLIEELKQYNRQLYTLQSWSSLEIALSSAHERLNDLDVKQVELDTALNQVQTAFYNLVLSTNLDVMAKQMETISQAALIGYTSQSADALHQAIQEAQALNTGASEQERIKAYSKVLNALDGLQLELKYQYELNSKMTAGFGFEGDKNATLAFLDGSYQIGGTRPMQNGFVATKQIVTFGATNTSGIKWYNAEGYLPVFINEFAKDNMEYKIESFGNKHTVESKDYVINYSRMTVTNHSDETRLLPVVSVNLVPMNQAANEVYTIKPGETVIREFAIEGDKYEYFDAGKTSFTSLTREQVSKLGTFDSNYSEMKSYWNNRLSTVVDIDLPNKELVNAFKAGYIYNMIIKDGNYLHVGENGYARLYSHDTIGIVVQLIQSGDFTHAREYLESIPLTGGINIETGQVDPNLFWDANWKLPWTYAVYLSKTGDTSLFDEKMKADDGSEGTVFDKRVKFGARSIESDRAGDGRIMKETKAIDSLGYWTIDNYSALTGLASYEYIARELYKVKGEASYLAEAEWANAQYEDLLAAFTDKLQKTITDKALNYIPASVVQSNDENRMKDSRDANWASMFLFGRWLWDGYLYGANQPEDNINLTMLDDTYTYGMDRRVNEGTTDSPYNFGGYPHGFYSSAYNAGYGSSALRGEKYRDMGIKAYEFMIENSMSGPFSWWEGVAYPTAESSPWTATNDELGVRNTPGGGGSAQHMWGQAVNSKVLVDSLITERIYDQNTKYEIIVGRGIPKEWVTDADKNNNVIANVQNYPAFQGGRVGYNVVRKANQLVFTFTTRLEQAKADMSNAQISVQLPSMVNNILESSKGVVDNAKGIVTVPLSTKTLAITLSDLPKPTDVELDREELAIGFATGDSNESVTQDVVLPMEGKRGSIITWSSSDTNMISNTGKVKRPTVSTQVTLTATLEKDGVQVQKTFVLTVAKADNDQGNTGNNSNNNNSNNGNSGNNGNNNNNGNNGNSVNPPKFTDISNHWAFDAIVKAVERGIIKGYEDGTFRPNGVVNRSELMVMLVRALKLPNTDTVIPFEDASSIPAWARSSISSAVKSGLIKGYEDNSFRPDGKVTRIEFVAMVARALDLKSGTKSTLPFADADQIPAWGKEYAAAAYEAGLIQGKGNDRFAPNDPVTRAEAVTLLLRMSK